MSMLVSFKMNTGAKRDKYLAACFAMFNIPIAPYLERSELAKCVTNPEEVLKDRWCPPQYKEGLKVSDLTYHLRPSQVLPPMIVNHYISKLLNHPYWGKFVKSFKIGYKPVKEYPMIYIVHSMVALRTFEEKPNIILALDGINKLGREYNISVPFDVAWWLAHYIQIHYTKGKRVISTSNQISNHTCVNEYGTIEDVVRTSLGMVKVEGKPFTEKTSYDPRYTSLVCQCKANEEPLIKRIRTASNNAMNIKEKDFTKLLQSLITDFNRLKREFANA